jgi:hypothetical protein
MDWPADQVIRQKVADLVPYAKNARLHSPEQVQQLANSIRQWGWTKPILVDEQGGIIAGHGRVLAAQMLELSTVPAMVARGWSETQKRAYVVADNKLALNGSWDDFLLRTELEELKTEGFDLALAGFSDLELEGLQAPDTDPSAEWAGMPEFNQPGEASFRTIVMHFQDQEAVNTFAALIGQPLSDKAKYAWFPPKPVVVAKDKRYAEAAADDAA